MSEQPMIDAGDGGASATAPRRRHTARWIAGAVLIALIVVAVVAATRPSVQATPVVSPLQGKAAPTFSGVAFDGQHVTSAGYRGHYVFVNFFASWCPPCSQEMPDLTRFDFQQHRSASGASVLSVVFDDPDAAARQFVQQWGATWPAIPDPDGVIANHYGVQSPPMTFLIDPKGVVVRVLVGPVTASQLDSSLSEARATDA